MEVRIGVVDNQKELVVEIGGDGLDDIVTTVEHAIAGKSPVLWLTDDDGRRVGVAADKVAYVELVTEDETHRVGFGKAE